MQIATKESLTVAREPDTVVLRNRVRELATRIRMGLVVQTKLLTAASELVRNMLRYGGGGEVDVETVISGPKTGVRLTFRDRGPGIADVKRAMQDGFSTGGSLGLGLPGTRRLVNEFDLRSAPGEGTTVMILCWKDGR